MKKQTGRRRCLLIAVIKTASTSTFLRGLSVLRCGHPQNFGHSEIAGDAAPSIQGAAATSHVLTRQTVASRDGAHQKPTVELRNNVFDAFEGC